MAIALWCYWSPFAMQTWTWKGTSPGFVGPRVVIWESDGGQNLLDQRGLAGLARADHRLDEAPRPVQALGQRRSLGTYVGGRGHAGRFPSQLLLSMSNTTQCIE
jgi:hypothetical protein